jgi:hypothetical protein
MKRCAFLIASVLCVAALSTTGSSGQSAPPTAGGWTTMASGCDLVQVHEGPCHEDINGDGVVSSEDLLHLLSCWGPVAVQACERANLIDIVNCPDPDSNSVNEVTAVDLLELLAAWGPCD